ncbi:MAG: TonB family protein [Candidatus Omnitrophota bacterium]
MRYQNFKKIFFCFFFSLFLLSGFIFGEDTEPLLVTNSFFETDIREVLRDISAQTKVKIVPDETVQGALSIELKEVPLEEALSMILSVGNYSFRRMPEGYYLIGLCTPNSPSFNKLSVTESFRPNYLKARELQTLISEFYQLYIKINEDANTITITAAPDVVKRIKEDLLKLDQPQRQVMLEALVIELSDEGKKSLGLTWGSMLEGGFSVYPPTNLDYTRTANKGAYSVAGTLSSDLLVRINTMISEGRAKVRANPRVATLEGKQAEISIGREEYYLINVGSTATAYYTLQSIATGVVLKITPYIDQNRQITVAIAPQVSEVIGKGATNLPVITKRTATTSLRVNDGQTIALGGLVQEQSNETITKVPFLSSLPLAGGLFRHKSTNLINKEVVIFITPRILDDKLSQGECQEKADAEKKYEGNSPAEEKIAEEDYLEEKDPIKKYYLHISGIIESHKQPPDLLNDAGDVQPKEVVLKFVVFSNGTVDSVEVARTSGLPDLDIITAKLIKNLSPFPPFPEEIKQQSISFMIPIRYESCNY